MGKPRMIILIRHAQSEGNKNRDIHQTIPDHRVKLTHEGWNQAKQAGTRLRSLLHSTDTLHFFTSPYRRTRETTEGILSTLTSDEPSPSPFPRHSIKVYEEPRLREQDFGNFQPCSNEMERMWQERADYGHFFYRIPNGESAADAYDRVSGFNESLWRQFGEEGFASVCVLVTHGLMSRIFLMKWYHFSVEYFEDLRNVNHCEFLIMRKKEDSGKYILENNLRTWSELKQERLAAAAAKEKEKEKEREKNNGASSTGLVSAGEKATGATDKDKEKERRLALVEGNGVGKEVPLKKKWGGCPNGCDHGKYYYKKENSMHAMTLNGRPTLTSSSSTSASTTTLIQGTENNAQQQSLQFRRPAARRWQSSSGEEDELDQREGFLVDVDKSLNDLVSSPDGTPSFISVEDRLRNRLKSPANFPERGLLSVRGADGEVGVACIGSGSEDTDHDSEMFSAEEDARKRAAKGKSVGRGANGKGRKNGGSGLGGGVLNGGNYRGALADALGDQSDVGSDAGVDGDVELEMVKLEKEEREDKSVKGSVY